MGQKVNPNIFRLGVSKTWKTEFFEKKRQELPLYTFKDLEIKNYIERFLETQGILLHDYKQHYTNNTLNLYISYYITPEFSLSKFSKDEKIILINNVGQKKLILGIDRVNSTLLDHYRIGVDLDEKTSSKSNGLKHYYKIKQYLKSNCSNEFFEQVSLKMLPEKPEGNEKLLSFEDSIENNVLNNMFSTINLFMNNKWNIVINFSCTNKNLNFFKIYQKRNLILLQKFRRAPFFKEGIELLFHVTYNRNSAHLLAKFVSLQIKKIKRHKFYLSFLKKTLTVLLNSTLSKVQGIKIIVKGRLNGAPRAKHKIITIGDVPTQRINANIDYSQTTSHNVNGSYGVKVWVIEKE
jgi:ribosomal protein S3